jgi:hypothetical protein
MHPISLDLVALHIRVAEADRDAVFIEQRSNLQHGGWTAAARHTCLSLTLL